VDFKTAIAESKSGRNALKAFKKLELQAERMPPVNELDSTLNQEKKVFKRIASTILRLADAGWWANAPKMPASHQLVGTLQGLSDKEYKIEILSSPFGEESKKGKLQWCKANLPEEFTAFHIRSDKESLASSHTLLIDDREKVCRKFEEAGGHAVVFDKMYLSSMLSVIKNNQIETVYVDLDGVLVDTRSHIVRVLESL
jgi:hypothetical protein